MRLVAALIALLALAAASPSGRAATVTVQPAADAGLPFWCDWGYDWEERCYSDQGPRLPVGGVDDKVWRAALRFPLGGVPASATISTATLRLHYDGVCVAPRLTSVRCEARGYTIDAHRLLSSSWYAEREPELDEIALASASLPAGAPSRWLSWDVTEVVRAWHRGTAPNDGLLLKLAEEEEAFGTSGPYFPSSGYADSVLRPRLVVTYTPAAG